MCRGGGGQEGTGRMGRHRRTGTGRWTGCSARHQVGQAEAGDPEVGATAPSGAQHRKEHPGELARNGLQSPRGAPATWGSQGPPLPRTQTCTAPPQRSAPQAGTSHRGQHPPPHIPQGLPESPLLPGDSLGPPSRPPIARAPPGPKGLRVWAPAMAASRGDAPLPGIGTHSPLAHAPRDALKPPRDPAPAHGAAES